MTVEGMMPIFLIIFFAALIFIVVKGVSQWMKNENAPVVATQARCIHRHCSSHTDANGGSSTSYYLLFDLSTGSRLELCVGGRVYRGVPEDVWGTLTFQGTRFLRFTDGRELVER